ncbi:sensor histidine kinase [Actinophytocola xanthii]|uniref:Histidine kinase/HSP90-like ATPase domain-containing protein n=1 Tax=Actinophytocola xanthii TaxID=1912961 RepID=A0A1Q8CY57_9PSEU|nr:ATP-binding protein [Actinophytocola xanthii]OLF19275.1 hypothetical protein BU204_02695 [Actinophytocola xanthii]
MSRPGEERALRFVAMMLFLQRVSYLAPAVADVARSATPYRSPALNLAMVVGAVGWNIGLATVVHRRGWFPRWAVAVDAVLAAGLLAAGTTNVAPQDVFKHINWPSKLALATGALVGAALAPWLAAGAVAALITTHFTVTVARLGELPLSGNGIVGVLNSYFWFVLIAYVMRRYLCGQGRALDEATGRQLELQARRAADRARYAERIAQYRRLHDTVLTTLTAIARGGLDHRTEAVRARCATEADYVRRLIHEDTAGPATELGTRLDTTITEVEQLGLRVRYQHDRLPAALPEHVVEALAGASREALNNVLVHAGTRSAWVTAVQDEGQLLVRIVDRGRGFDPDAVPAGFGLRNSIVGRMRDAGGEATVVGMPGAGVRVDLVWPSGENA